MPSRYDAFINVYLPSTSVNPSGYQKLLHLGYSENRIIGPLGQSFKYSELFKHVVAQVAIILLLGTFFSFRVGLMHGGTLAVEDYTDSLLQTYHCDSLENVFLEICRQSASIDSETSVDPTQCRSYSRSHSNEQTPPAKDGSRISLKDFRIRTHILEALIWKNLIHLYRYPGVLIFVMLMPCIHFASMVFSTNEDLGQAKLAIVNEDLGTLGIQFSKILEGKAVHLDSFESSKSAFEALREGRVQGFVFIQQNFSDAHLERIVHSPLLENRALNNSIITITIDNVEPHSNFLRLHVLQCYSRFLHSTFNDSGLNQFSAQPVFLFGHEDMEYLSHPSTVQLDIAAVVVVAYFAPVAVAVFTLFVELHCGYLERSVVAGVTSVEIVLGLLFVLLAVACFQILSTLVTGFLLGLGRLSWGTSSLLFVVLYFTGISGLSGGIFLSLCSIDIQQLLVIAGNVILLSAMTSGGFWPLMAVPTFMRYIFLAMPLAYPVRAVGAIYTGAKFYLAEVTCSLAISLSHTVLFLALSVVLLHLQIKA